MRILGRHETEVRIYYGKVNKSWGKGWASPPPRNVWSSNISYKYSTIPLVFFIKNLSLNLVEQWRMRLSCWISGLASLVWGSELPWQRRALSMKNERRTCGTKALCFLKWTQFTRKSQFWSTTESPFVSLWY